MTTLALHPVLVLAGLLAVAPAPARAPADPLPPPAAPEPIDRPTPTLEAPALEPPDFEDPLRRALTPVPGGLTAAQVAARASAASPTVAIKAVEIEQAAARVDQTMIAFLPVIGGSASYTRLSKVKVNFGSGAIVGVQNPGPLVVGPCPAPLPGECVLDSMGQPAGAAPFAFSFPLNSYSLQATLAVPISDYVLSLSPARKGSIATKEATKLARDAERIKVEADAQIAYYNWLRSVAQVVVAEESLVRTRARLADAQIAFEAGILSKADVLRLDSVVASAESGTVQARTFRDLMAKNLSILMQSDDDAFAVGEDVLGAGPSRSGEDLDTLIAEGQRQRLELRALSRNAEAVDYGIRSLRAGYFPRLDGFAEATYANPNQRFFPLQNKWNPSWSVGAKLTYTINQSLRTRAQIKEIRGDARKLALQEDAMRRGVAMEVTQAYLDQGRAIAAIELTSRAQRSAEEAYRVTAELYRAGSATTTDVIEAELARVTTTLQEVNARIDLRVADLRLRHATGRLTPAVP